MARGKGADVLSLDELTGEGKEGALVDVVLEPGQVLEALSRGRSSEAMMFRSVTSKTLCRKP